MLIYLHQTTARTQYTFDLVFKEHLGISYELTSDKDYFRNYKGEKISYTSEHIGNEYFIQSSGLLFENNIIPIETNPQWVAENPILFANDGDIGYDIFASVFYLVSRYEEYLPFTPDKFGRFKAEDSIAYKNCFLELPVVDIWITDLKNELSKKYLSLIFKERRFKAILTYDIDIAYAYKGRSLMRNLGAIGKDIIFLKANNLFKRISSLLGIKRDPWDIYDDLRQELRRSGLDSIFFFLLGNYSDKDKNISFSNKHLRKLIKKVSSFSQVGIHPSFYSTEAEGKIRIEKSRLQDIFGTPVTKSRQHYLKFQLPETYNNLVKEGIKEEYSMGYANMPGFRAGTCSPFCFYDLKNESTTSLKIFPVTCMDATFIYYGKQAPVESIKKIKALIDIVRDNNGTFISIWHNNTLSDTKEFKGWKETHDEMIAYLNTIN